MLVNIRIPAETLFASYVEAGFTKNTYADVIAMRDECIAIAAAHAAAVEECWKLFAPHAGWIGWERCMPQELVALHTAMTADQVCAENGGKHSREDFPIKKWAIAAKKARAQIVAMRRELAKLS